MAVARDLFGRRVSRRKAPPPRERATHIAIADLLRQDCRYDWWWTTIPSGELRTESTGALLRRMGLKPGIADFMLISPEGMPHWLELKRENLGKLSEDQQAFEQLCQRTGMPHAVAKNFVAAKDQLDAWGVLRGRLHLT